MELLPGHAGEVCVAEAEADGEVVSEAAKLLLLKADEVLDATVLLLLLTDDVLTPAILLLLLRPAAAVLEATAVGLALCVTFAPLAMLPPLLTYEGDKGPLDGVLEEEAGAVLDAAVPELVEAEELLIATILLVLTRTVAAVLEAATVELGICVSDPVKVPLLIADEVFDATVPMLPPLLTDEVVTVPILLLLLRIVAAAVLEAATVEFGFCVMFATVLLPLLTNKDDGLVVLPLELTGNDVFAAAVEYIEGAGVTKEVLGVKILLLLPRIVAAAVPEAVVG